MANTVMHVDGMTCSHCKSAVEKALKTLEGVQEASVDLNSKKVSVDYDPVLVDENSLRKSISAAGYDVK